MTNNNENEATGTGEISAEVAHKIGVEMGLWRMNELKSCQSIFHPKHPIFL